MFPVRRRRAGGGGSGSGILSIDRAFTDELGDIPSTSTSWTEIAGLSLDLTPSVGDVLEITLNAGLNNVSGAAGGVNIQVASTRIHPASRGWYHGLSENVYTPFEGTLYHTVASGDFGDGVVTVKGMMRRQGASGTFNIANDGDYGTAFLTVKNLGPVSLT